MLTISAPTKGAARSRRAASIWHACESGEKECSETNKLFFHQNHSKKSRNALRDWERVLCKLVWKKVTKRDPKGLGSKRDDYPVPKNRLLFKIPENAAKKLK